MERPKLHRQPVYETPHIDALAAAGVRFTQAYAACAVCSPTRAAVLTGRYPARLGVTDWIRPRHSRDAAEYKLSLTGGFLETKNKSLATPVNRFELELEEVTLAEVLQTAGFATQHVGKWHLGDPGHWPTDQGFDATAGGCDFGQPPSYFDPYANKQLDGIPTLPPRQAGEYLADREADEAAAFIRQHRDRPFCLCFWPYEVHTPLQAKPELVAHYQEKASRIKTPQKNPTYAAMVQSMDEAVGKIVDTLDAEGVRDRTLIVFTSDNGGLLGPTNNAPLRSGKGYPYEGGIRVPLIVTGPGVRATGTIAAPVCSIDLLPTILDAVGLPPLSDPIDGQSLWPLLRGAATDLDRAALLWHFPHYRGQDVVPYSILRLGNWKLIRFDEGPTFELYDLATDPREQHDVAAEQPDRVQQMNADLSARLRDMGARLPRPAAAKP